ncbi:MAG TPA: ATP-binding protein [Lacunisphaera sp.]|nr:ATP-binding protein [Lacunisphaera sp.]
MKALSLRWKLAGWIALLLLGLLTGFGVTAYQWVRHERLNRLDEALAQRAVAVASDLRFPMLWNNGQLVGPGRFFSTPGQPRRDRTEPSASAAPGAGADAVSPPPPAPGSSLEPRPAVRDRGETPPAEPPGESRQFRLSRLTSRLFSETDEAGYYYVLWGRSETPRHQSANAPHPAVRPPAPDIENQPNFSTRADWRECTWLTDRGELIVTGISLTAFRRDLGRFAWWLGGAGLGVLLLGITGGWVVASGAMKPIEDISSAARKISAGNLSERIPVRDPGDEVGRLAGVLNSTFARLEAAFAEQRQFTADASHEIRTPLTVVIAEAQAALARPRSNEEYRATLETCLEAAQDLRRLTNSLLDLARLDLGESAIHRQAMNLADTAESCTALIRPLAEARRIVVETDLKPATLNADAGRLRQVMINLLDNAIHYNFDGGTVSVQTRSEASQVLLVVRDTGRGIAAEDLPHIFNRFYRSDPARTQTGNRLGLGLAIVKTIVDMHGGRIEVASQLGLGTTFKVHLPA